MVSPAGSRTRLSRALILDVFDSRLSDDKRVYYPIYYQRLVNCAWDDTVTIWVRTTVIQFCLVNSRVLLGLSI
jgi:hypothetical protein